ncbi:hypothetical protein ED729_23030 [Escherichia coli]|nr:hypothetical protein [Escherichia coli]
MYKWGGKEGCRLLFRIYSTSYHHPPVTPLRSAFGPYREKVASRYRNGWVAFGERLEVFQGNGRVACVDFGKRLDDGSGTAAYRYSVRESFGYPPAMCGKKRGAHVQADLLTAGFPLNARYSVIVPDSQRVTIDFSRFSGRGLFCHQPLSATKSE